MNGLQLLSLLNVLLFLGSLSQFVGLNFPEKLIILNCLYLTFAGETFGEPTKAEVNNENL